MEVDKNKEISKVKEMLSGKDVSEFIKANLSVSLKSIGYSKSLIEDLFELLTLFHIKEFQNKHGRELHRVHTVGFFQKIVPEYFGKYVVPSIPPVDKVLDIGCGTGILAHVLSESGNFKQVVGIDINKYPEWKKFANQNTIFHIVDPDNFGKYLEESNPDAIVLTWTLHHMSFKDQENYMKTIFNSVGKIKIVVLEDSYSTELKPVEDAGVYNRFMKFSKKDRQKIMSVNDWIANRVLERREKIPMTFTYRTVEEWERFFCEIGFTMLDKKFIGSFEKRDIYNPDSLLVIEK